MIEQALYDHLMADSGVTAITTSMYPMFMPQSADPPAITYQVIFSEQDNRFEGQTGGYRQTTMQVNCISDRYLEATNLADAVESALIDFRGNMGSVSPALFIDYLRLEMRSSDIFEDETELYRVQMDFLIGY